MFLGSSLPGSKASITSLSVSWCHLFIITSGKEFISYILSDIKKGSVINKAMTMSTVGKQKSNVTQKEVTNV